MVPLRLFSTLQSLPLVASLGFSAVVCAQDPGPVDPVYEQGQRIVKYFDFDEHEHNLEDLPMFWRRHEAPGFPPYARGRFDVVVGHQAPPSFYLELQGKSCAYHYEGLDIHVQPGNDYHISAYVRTDRLEYGRAYMTAYLLDANGQRLAGVERVSDLVGAMNSQAKQWQLLQVRLPGDVDAAFSIGLTLWVTQPAHWSTASRPNKHIEHQDVQGGAWFDDITIYRLPSISLTSNLASEGNVFSAGQTPVLIAQAGDINKQVGRKAVLTVRDATGAEVWTSPVPSGSVQSEQVSLPDLGPGLYESELSLLIGNAQSVSRLLRFLVLPAATQGVLPDRSHFGVILESEENWEADHSLVRHLGVKNVKVPVFENNGSEDASVAKHRNAFIKHLIELPVSVTGLITNDHERRQQGPKPFAGISLIDLFSKPANAWQPALANAVTRYESFLKIWQIGADDQTDVFEDARLTEVLNSIRSEMAKMTTSPVIVAPWTAHLDPGTAKLPTENLAITIPTDVPPSEIPRHLAVHFGDLNYQQLWLYVSALPRERYQRIPRLADFAKRMTYAMQSGAHKVFISQPWTTRREAGVQITEPTEDYLVYQTIIRMLDGAEFLGQLRFHKSITCLAFDRLGKTTFVMWDDTAPLSGAEHILQLSGADRLTDLWGRQQTLRQIDGEHAVVLSPIPVFIHGADSWLVQFRQALRFEPDILPSERSFHEHQVVIYNPRHEPISGSIRLEGPQGWQIRPSFLDFSIQPSESISKTVRIQAAPREPAGVKHIRAKVVIDASRLHQFEDSLPLELGLEDMDVWADIVLEGDVLVVRHGVTNFSDHQITLRSFVDAPMRKRQNLNIRDLQPEQSIVKRHYFENASQLSGALIRVGLKQEGGPGSRVHDLSLTVP